MFGEYVLEVTCHDGSTFQLLATVRKKRLQHRVNTIQAVIHVPVTEGPSYGFRLGRLFSSAIRGPDSTSNDIRRANPEEADKRKPASNMETSEVADEHSDSVLVDALADEATPEPVDWMPPVLVIYARVLPHAVVAIVFLSAAWGILLRGSAGLGGMFDVIAIGIGLKFGHAMLLSASRLFLAGHKQGLVAYHTIFGLLLLLGGAFWGVAFSEGEVVKGVVCLLVQAGLLGPYFWYVARCEKRFQFREVADKAA